MNQPPEEPMDPGLEAAAALLKGLPHEHAPAPVTSSVVARVRPVARRRRMVAVAALVSAVAALAAYAWAALDMTGGAP